jgi:arginine/ornithine transport system permease protein
VSVIGLNDVMQRATEAAGATRQPFTFYLAVGALYLLLSSLSVWALHAWERRLSVGAVSAQGMRT